MPISGPILKIIIGIIFTPFIFGIFLIITGAKELRDCVNNNNSSENCLLFNDNDNLFKAYTIDNYSFCFSINDYVNLDFNLSNNKLYLYLNQNGSMITYNLGYCEFNKYKEFKNKIDQIIIK